MILNDGEWNGRQIVSEYAVGAMTSLQTGPLTTGFTPGNGWGLGWCIVRKPQDVTGMLSPGTFGHGGAWGTQGWVDPVRERVFVLMIQRSNLPNSDASDIRKEFQRAAVDAMQMEQ
jgi:CubicO group peptidase (beta-lactamase class C family)